MDYIKTTLRLRKDLKQTAEKKAVDKGVSFQEIVNTALYNDLVGGNTVTTKARSLRDHAKKLDKDIPEKIDRDFIYDKLN